MLSTHLLRKRENARLQAAKISSLPALSLSAYLDLIISASCDVASMNVPFLAMLFTITEQSIMSPAAPRMLVCPPACSSPSRVGGGVFGFWSVPFPSVPSRERSRGSQPRSYFI
jgi:hypothetical protein